MSPRCKHGQSKSPVQRLRKACANTLSINGNGIALERVLGPNPCAGGAPVRGAPRTSAISDLFLSGTNGLRIEVASRAKAEGLSAIVRFLSFRSWRALPARP